MSPTWKSPQITQPRTFSLALIELLNMPVEIVCHYFFIQTKTKNKSSNVAMFIKNPKPNFGGVQEKSISKMVGIFHGISHYLSDDDQEHPYFRKPAFHHVRLRFYGNLWPSHLGRHGEEVLRLKVSPGRRLNNGVFEPVWVSVSQILHVSAREIFRIPPYLYIYIYHFSRCRTIDLFISTPHADSQHHADSTPPPLVIVSVGSLETLNTTELHLDGGVLK